MQFSMLLQGTLGLILPNAEGVDLGIKNIGAEIASIIQRQQAIGAPGDRPVVEPRPATRPVTVELEEAVQPSGTNVAQEASIRSAEYNLTPELKKALGEVRTNLKVTGVDTAFTGLMAAAMIAGTVASWEANDQEGAIGIAKNVVSVIGDAVAAVQFGTKIAETYLRFQQIKSLESGSVEMVEEAAKIKDTLKSLEKFSKFLSGALNVAFGVLNILSGTQELEKGGSQKLNGQLDVASGAFLVAGGAVELASLTTLGAGLAETGIGELIAGIGMEISIVKIWVGGRASIGAFGESLAEFFGADAGLSQEDQTINYIINVKQVAVYSQVSRKATKSPDPRDGGAESNRYLIEPPYSVADVADS
ncbi:hypothetical protein SISSUDRAFT_465716 [Sistotremastrum suecicum HHB10207 ss-3]|uniref:Uncharacterized protein n=1 Tax=Sistotremastrum suecicum HHB10207 ss-3 TaxID=1314776 RepID=A0A166FEJ3_9AGAM|nr:hypothetical protein SISSUDRAFT_465716 [Sistotremastrum suecicum HHB10207 ss-3]